MSEALTFAGLVATIEDAHGRLKSEAVRAVNMSLTIRNWLVGAHIVEYEQEGEDRAAYGTGLLERLSAALASSGRVKYRARELRRCRQFYLAYPQFRVTLSPELARLGDPERSPLPIRVTLSPESQAATTRLLKSLSFNHFGEILEIDDPRKREFYEAECLAGGWSVRQLRRQITSLLFERTILSTDQTAIRAYTAASPHMAPESVLSIRDPYIFEFLGLRPSEAVTESAIEDAMLDKIQEFLLELGRGFCFEARQRRILIGDEHFFVDLVFYHRILKCHVLIELKDDQFRHEHLGQLNTYLNWYRANEQSPGDNPPVGVLLCTAKNHALVEYATAGLDNRLFVSKYQVELPTKEELERLIKAELRERE